MSLLPRCVVLFALISLPLAHADAFSQTDAGPGYTVPHDGTLVTLTQTIVVEDITDVIDQSPVVESAVLSLEFYDFDINPDVTECGLCSPILTETGDVTLDGHSLGVISVGVDGGYGTNVYDIPTAALPDLDDGEAELVVEISAHYIDPCGLNLSETADSLHAITLEGSFTFEHRPVAVGAASGTDADDTCVANVVLDGSSSTDDDSSELTNDDIVSFDWDVNGDGVSDATGETATVELAIGFHTIVLTVEDSTGLIDTDTFEIEVEEGAIEYDAWADPNTLGPPDHLLVEVGYGVAGTWVCSGDSVDEEDLDWQLVDVVSNEPDDAPGPFDGSTTGDIDLRPDGTLFLRAERDGRGNGTRVYTLSFEVLDGDGAVVESPKARVLVERYKGCRGDGCASMGPGPAGSLALVMLGLVAIRRRR